MTEQPLGPFPKPESYQPIVQRLKDMIERNNWKDKFERAVHDAYKTGVEDMTNISSLTDYYNFLNYFVLWVPKEDETGAFVYNMLGTMYFVLDQKTVRDFQSPIKPSSYPPPPLTELSKWIVDFAGAMGQFLDTPQSLTEESLQTFYTAENYNVDAYVVPEGGWLGHSFNEFFARKFLPGTRPIDGPSNPAVIVSAADSTFDGSWDINTDSIVYLKGLSWTIGELLADSKYANDFAGGKFMHAFLSPYDYHRQHAPVDGKVLEAKVIPGQTYLEVNIKKHSDGKHRLIPTRGLVSPDSAGYQFCQTRGLIVIDSPKVGKVAVLPVGMAQVSSVVLSVKEGDEVKKGDELSYFQFGGSDIVLLFQAQSKVKILANEHKHYRVGEQIAIAHIAE
ncbi:phosphatidylserine decarboxylase-related protein [Rhizophagus irregularis DAOM 181602=DAOM 197198]|uniref:Phosphatidylserine decarboxylase 2 n=2 Tax=Rhizophagus irregularis TaxID=588596 RepID=A0A015K5Z1_RHIIW|nr:phosphatidylserine decarboxylase-related protein [Rhizophagus irregularis DAOM 181602=DAOM 197198]EXX75015.1 phosphatidylserine decarboxylase 2 [Rhizophagus irregularis DAOM 197198w]POG69066.1 phosphatidylserine decarboxylase-related protein [Rhizophagus irregularis DAOM 181602=DAOM 197198]CAG8597672.1 22429_t:CDS:1 [Rhizophagus irregularis]|eukprot:XP_025175932.1 phosphatidylserine decarboxylase-related protein [Rhizophagus irregularis DAOM 181602=DAOM 197198]